MRFLAASYPPFPPAPSPPAGTKGSFNSPFGFVAPNGVLLARGRGFACRIADRVPCGVAFVCPHIPPAPSPPAGTKGSLNSPFGFVAPDTVLLARGCGALLVACMGGRGGRSKRLRGGGADRLEAPVAACDVRAGERACGLLLPFGRAEQRSGARIRAGACLSEASLRPTPSGASSAGQPAGPRSTARLSFAYFSLAKQRKVSRPPGRNPASPNSQAKSLPVRTVMQ